MDHYSPFTLDALALINKRNKTCDKDLLFSVYLILFKTKLNCKVLFSNILPYPHVVIDYIYFPYTCGLDKIPYRTERNIDLILCRQQSKQSKSLLFNSV